MDVLPWHSEKASTRSRQDKEAIHLLETKTKTVEVDGVQRYATPLLRTQNIPKLQAPKVAVLPQLRNTEKRLSRDPDQAAAYKAEIERLEEAGYVVKLGPSSELTPISWYISHP